MTYPRLICLNKIATLQLIIIGFASFINRSKTFSKLVEIAFLFKALLVQYGARYIKFSFIRQ